MTHTFSNNSLKFRSVIFKTSHRSSRHCMRAETHILVSTPFWLSFFTPLGEVFFVYYLHVFLIRSVYTFDSLAVRVGLHREITNFATIPTHIFAKDLPKVFPFPLTSWIHKNREEILSCIEMGCLGRQAEKNSRFMLRACC